MIHLFALIWLIECFIYIHADYLYGEIDKNLVGKTNINFTIYFKKSTGLILYGRDVQNNSILMTMRQAINENLELQINFNNKDVSNNLTFLCNCSKCFDDYISFEIDINDRSNLNEMELTHFKCNNHRIKFYKAQKTKSVQLVNYPIPKNFNYQSNGTFIWIGNIGPFNGLLKEYPPSKEQIKGCLLYFKVNNTSLIFSKNKTKFFSFCITNYYETVFNFTQYSDKTKSEWYTKEYTKNNISVSNDCRFWIINFTFCGKELPMYHNHNKSFLLNNLSNHPIKIHLSWQTYFNTNYCLIELKLNDGSNISLCQKPNTIFYIHNDQLLKLMQLDSKYINNLLWTFASNQFTLKINNGDRIFTFNGYSIANITKINIGFSEQNKDYSIFEGLLNTTFDPSEIFILNLSSSSSPSPSPNYYYFSIGILLPLFNIMFIGVALKVIHKYKTNIEKFMRIKRPIKEHFSDIQNENEYFVMNENEDYGMVYDKKIIKF